MREKHCKCTYHWHVRKLQKPLHLQTENMCSMASQTGRSPCSDFQQMLFTPFSWKEKTAANQSVLETNVRTFIFMNFAPERILVRFFTSLHAKKNEKKRNTSILCPTLHNSRDKLSHPRCNPIHWIHFLSLALQKNNKRNKCRGVKLQ